MNILGISGSLRSESNNSRLLAAVGRCIPQGVAWEVTTLTGKLPHFSPDLDPAADESVQAWVDQVRSSDGIVVSTPEYARGYPGTLKNALDWLVQTDAHIDKPFMMLNASARSTVARDTLTTVLETMSGIHIAEASLTIALLGKSQSAEEILATGDTTVMLTNAMQVFIHRIEARRTVAES